MRLLSLFMLMGTLCFSQNRELISEDISINEFVDGTLLRPNNNNSMPLVIIIPGSGPTDRNGNQNFLKNNSLKKLAEGLASNNIASFRMDKRIVKQIKRGNVNLDIKFSDFVTDAISVVNYFKENQSFDKIFVAGHSQGSLVGMLAINEDVDGYISLAGAGRSIDEVLLDQINKTARIYYDDTKRVLDVLKEGNTTSDYPQALASIFNKDIQPFMISWIQYNPTQIIENLDIPVLIINGTKDLQVSVDEAELLHKAAKDSEFKIIDKMNHVLFIIEGDDLENSKSYNESQRPISAELIKTIVNFINN